MGTYNSDLLVDCVFCNVPANDIVTFKNKSFCVCVSCITGMRFFIECDWYEGRISEVTVVVIAANHREEITQVRSFVKGSILYNKFRRLSLEYMSSVDEVGDETG